MKRVEIFLIEKFHCPQYYLHLMFHRMLTEIFLRFYARFKFYLPCEIRFDTFKRSTLVQSRA